LDRGFKKQDRAAIFLLNSAESVVSTFAVLKSGGVFLIINPLVKAKKIEYILNDSQAKILITDAGRLREISGILPRCSNLETIMVIGSQAASDKDFKDKGKEIVPFASILKKYPSQRPPKRCIDIDLASLVYTSGSTGDPKGVMLTHLNMVSAANSIIEYLESREEDIVIDVFPLSFDYGLYQVLMAIKFGGTVVLEKSFLYPYKIIDLILKEKITVFPVVPTIAAILFKLGDLNKFDFSSVRCVTNTAQAMPPKYFSRLQKVFPKARIYSMYGLTECKRVSYLPPEELEKRPTSVGKAMPNTEVFIVDGYGNKITKPGVIGELVVRGANVMKGYWNLPRETDRVLRPGPLPSEKVLYTGDLFKMDEEGYLYFVSRKDDVLKIAGALASPKEIENALYEIDDVAEAAVVGVDDEILGQAAKAFVVLKKGSKLTDEDVKRFCSSRIEKFMVPKYIEILDELPKSSHGKVSRRELT
jgi:acyl-CoA synthetase (AMP-forming)/AMP-acid ligase II